MPKLDVGSGAYSQTARLLDEWANQPDSSIGTTDYHDYYDDDVMMILKMILMMILMMILKMIVMMILMTIMMINKWVNSA